MNRHSFFFGMLATVMGCVLTAGCDNPNGKQHHDHEHHHQTETEHHQTDAELHHDHERHHQTGAEQANAHRHEITIDPEHARMAGIAAEVINPKPFRQTISVSGQVTAAQGEESTVVATVPGVIRFRRSLTEGLYIGQGSAIFNISSKHMADGNPAERARITYEAAKKEFERVEGLIADKIVSGKEYNRIKEAYETARINYEALVRDQSTAGGGVTITAPMAGFIKDVRVHEGEYVTAGQPLMDIARNNKLYLRADVPEKHYAALGQIRKAHFKTSYSDSVYCTKELGGQLLSYGRNSGGASQHYIPVTFEIENSNGLIPGAFTEVWLLTDERPNVLCVPIAALTEEQGVHYIYIRQDEEGYARREVKTGGNDGREVEILAGLHAGECVVTQGAYQVRLASVSKSIPGHTHEH